MTESEKRGRPTPARQTSHEISRSEELNRARMYAKNSRTIPHGFGHAGGVLPPGLSDTGTMRSEFVEISGYFLGRLWALVKLPFRLVRRIVR